MRCDDVRKRTYKKDWRILCDKKKERDCVLSYCFVVFRLRRISVVRQSLRYVRPSIAISSPPAGPRHRRQEAQRKTKSSLFFFLCFLFCFCFLICIYAGTSRDPASAGAPREHDESEAQAGFAKKPLKKEQQKYILTIMVIRINSAQTSYVHTSEAVAKEVCEPRYICNCCQTVSLATSQSRMRVSGCLFL